MLSVARVIIEQEKYPAVELLFYEAANDLAGKVLIVFLASLATFAERHSFSIRQVFPATKTPTQKKTEF